MGRCVGCGEPLAPAWKFCVHCGIAVVGSQTAVVPAGAQARKARTATGLILGGIGVFLVGIALLVVAIAFLTGSFG